MAVRALTDDGFGVAQCVLSVPRALNQIEQVHTIGEAIGRPLQFQEISREAAQQELIDAWGDPSMVEGALNAWAEMVGNPEQVAPTVEGHNREPGSRLSRLGDRPGRRLPLSASTTKTRRSAR